MQVVTFCFFARCALLTSDGFLFLEPFGGYKAGGICHILYGVFHVKNIEVGIPSLRRVLTSSSMNVVPLSNLIERVNLKRSTLEHYLSWPSRLLRIQMLDEPDQGFSHNFKENFYMTIENDHDAIMHSDQRSKCQEFHVPAPERSI